MNSTEQRIREFAYQIWQSEGKPHGQASRHWEMASKLVASDIQQSAGIASPKTKSTTKKQTQADAIATESKPVKKAKAATATALKPEAEKKIKAKTSEKKVSEKTAAKKPAAAKKTKVIESQPT